MILNLRLLFVALFFLSTTLFSKPLENLTTNEKQWLQTHKEVDFTGDPHWLPFEAFDEKGNYVGIIADFLKIIEEHTGVHFKKHVVSTWQESLELLKSHKVQMLTVSTDTKLSDDFLLSNSFLSNPIVIIMNEKMPYVDSLYQIKDKTIAMIRDYGYVKKIKEKYPNYHFVEVENIHEGLQAVAEGKYDAMLTSMALGSYMITDMQLANIAVVGKTEFTTKLAFAVDKDYAPLVGIVNKVGSIIDEHTKQQILHKWVSRDYVEKIDYTLLWQIAFVASLIILGTLFWSWRLKKEIARRIVLEKENEKMLAQQAKHAALGEMMDAVAHQWKQPLNAIVMMNELLLLEYKDGSLDEEYLLEHKKDTDAQVEHLLTTLSEFRSFFRPDKEPEKFFLKESIEAVLLLVRDDLLKHTIEVELVCDESIKINVIKNEFKHVLLNLLSNARDAFVENDIKHRKLQIIVKELPNEVEVQILDNAGGIPEHILPHIFDANVTSKVDGKGTGIGLYMSKQIVDKMSASITAQNHENGALFTLHIPSS